MGAALPMPGPWHTIDTDRGIYIIGPSSSLLAIVQPYYSNVVQNEANARLIAAAPDLLEALIASLSLDPLRMELEDCLDDEREALVAELQQIEAQISAAIARATGEAS